jgi:putative phosphoribosyl transferase
MPDALTQPFADRREAGAIVAQQLRHYAHRADVIVLGLPRGGVPVAYEVATVLGVPLDAFPVRKLGVPGQPELAMGAIALGGVRVLNREVIDWFSVPEQTIEAVTDVEQRELARLAQALEKNRSPIDVRGRTTILVDDGLATGFTMQAAVHAMRQLGAGRVVVAAPVGAPDTVAAFSALADEVICARQPGNFHAVGEWYLDFLPTTEDEVDELLARARQAPVATNP